MLTKSQYAEVKARLAVYEAWRATLPGKGQCITQEVLRTAPCSVTNDERSAVEVYEFMCDKPEKYFLYINCDKSIATTWMGEQLGTVSFGNAFRDNFGGMRVAITIRAITGESYHGYYFKTAGDYACIRKAKHQKAA